MKTCLGLGMSVWLTLMLAATETETTGSQEFSIVGKFSTKSELKVAATVLVSQEVLTDTGVIEAVELSKGKFTDGEVLLSGMVDSPTLVTITVSYDDYDPISTSAVVAPNDDLVFRVIQTEDGTPNRLIFVGNLSLHTDKSKKFTVVGDLNSLEEIVSGTTVSVFGRDSEGSKNYGSVLIAENGTFKIENEVSEPRVGWISVQNDQGYYFSSQTILEPQVSVSIAPDSQGTGLIVRSDGDYHAKLFDSWAKNEKYLALEGAHSSALAKYQKEMAARQKAIEHQSPEESTDGESKGEISAENEGMNTAGDTFEDDTKETIPISALALGIPPDKECTYVDLTKVKPSMRDIVESRAPEHIKLQNEVKQFRYRALESVAQYSDNPIASLLAFELGAFGALSEELHRGLDVLDDLAARLDEDLVARRLSPRRPLLAPVVKFEINNRNLVPGQKAPMFTLPDLEGVDHSLQQTLESNDVVLVEWWASWCGPCIEKFPDLKKLHATYLEAGFQVLSVNVDETYEEWKQETEKHQLPWLNLAEPDGELEDTPVTFSYGVNWYPTGYVVDKTGCILQKNLGIDMLTEFLEEKYGDMPEEVDLESTDASSG